MTITYEKFVEYNEESENHYIVFSCFDNMKARKIAFLKWWNSLSQSWKEIYCDVYSKGGMTVSELDDEQIEEIFQIKDELLED